MNEPIRWLEHFIELRRRLIQSLVGLTIIFLILMCFANPLYHLLAIPLLKNLPVGSQMIATSVASPLIVPLKFAFYLACMLAIPLIFYHAWSFVAPGLYPEERQLIWPLLFGSTFLFICGMLFAYILIFPMLFKVFAQALPLGVAMMTDINAYLSFVMRLFFAFGLTFEIPLIIVFLVKTGFLRYQKLKEFRPYAIVVAFILGMLMTPPDVMSQITLAIPMCLLYELGLWIAKLIDPEKNRHNEVQ
jgi:sec-independent protein translocase protein TatC